MEKLKEISGEDFARQYKKQSFDEWENVFSIKNISPVFPRWDGFCVRYRSEYYGSLSEMWAFIWNGPHCQYGDIELVPGVTVVTGSEDFPLFFSPAEFVKCFDFTNYVPYTGYVETEGAYSENLEHIKAQILKLAK